MADWGEKFQSAWNTIKRKAGACAANTDLEDLKASVQLGQKRIDQALLAGKIAQGDSSVLRKLTEANGKLGKIGEALELAQNTCLDIVAVNKIHGAVSVLSDENIIYNDPQGSAAAFDMLFQGFGRLCRFLPPPANEVQQFFENFNLFGNMAPKLIPELRWKDTFSQIDGFR